MNVGPYSTGGNPNHPGVKGGQPYNSGPIGGMTKVDVPGTGTFTPDQQGTVNKAQPAGLSSSNQYGTVQPGQGFRVMGNAPTPEGASVTQQPQVPGVNVALDADAASIEDNQNGQENQNDTIKQSADLSDSSSEDADA